MKRFLWCYRIVMVCVALSLCAIAVTIAGCASTQSYMNPAEVNFPGGVSTNGGTFGAVSGAALGGSIGGGFKDAKPFVPPESLPRQSEELWVIERSRAMPPAANAAPRDDVPGTGALMTQVDQKPVPVPLKHTSVVANVTGYISTVDVTQQFTNPFDTKIEALYVFPLPENSAVNEFVMHIGDRQIRGIIREKEEAQRIYNQAKSEGYVASLLTQDRPNVFTQAVANIEPGKNIDISIRYFNTLAYSDGAFEFVFPMVVAPRFNPPGTTDGVGAVARNDYGKSGQSIEVQYLAPTERSGHDIDVTVNLDAGTPIEKLESVNHKIVTTMNGENRATVKLADADRVPNKDFVLRCHVAGDVTKTATFVQKDANGSGGYFTMLLVPPATSDHLERAPVEMIFTLDVSGSMSGTPIDQSKAAITYARSKMQPGDSFDVVKFYSSAETMTPSPVPATRENIAAAQQYIGSMNAGGGTMMLEGIRRTLQISGDESKVRYVCFMTDGCIGNETDIIREVAHLRNDAKIFSFGVGSSPNRYLLDGIARAGAGAVAYLSNNENGADVMDAFFTRISRPALSDISLRFDGVNVKEFYPSKIPDLYVGRPVVVCGRYEGESPAGASVTLNGRVGREMTQTKLALDGGQTHDGIRSVWARAKISELCQLATYEPNNELPVQIKTVALNYGLMSEFTSFVAVDSTQVTAGDHGVTVVQPVPVPAGMRYDTTVGQ